MDIPLNPLIPFPPSPASRRRHRGRGTIVLDNVTASAVTNAVIMPDTSFPEGLPTPSPDEMVIAARGRRSLPLTFSPDVHTTPLRHKHMSKNVSQLARGWQTPPNSVSRLLLPTRTSPRKRLTLSDSPPTHSSPSTSSPNSTSSPEKQVKRSPISKRYRIQQQLFQQVEAVAAAAAAAAASSPDTSVDPATMLKGLSQEQMVGLLTDLMEKRPEIKEDVRNLMPEPDLTAMEDKLNYLKRNVFKSLPNTRLESKTDSMAYNRVSTHLMAFKKAVLDQSKQLCDAQSWTAVLDHSIMAWAYVRSTPVWDNPPHNSARKQCFKVLSANALQAIKKGVWTSEASMEIKERMSSMEKDWDDIGLCIKQLDIIINNGNLSSPVKKL